MPEHLTYYLNSSHHHVMYWFTLKTLCCILWCITAFCFRKNLFCLLRKFIKVFVLFTRLTYSSYISILRELPLQLANIMGRFQWLTCPRKVRHLVELSTDVWRGTSVNFLKKFMATFDEAFHTQDLATGWLHCDPGPLFKPESFPLPGWVSKLILVRSELISHAGYITYTWSAVQQIKFMPASNWVLTLESTLDYYVLE